MNCGLGKCELCLNLSLSQHTEGVRKMKKKMRKKRGRKVLQKNAIIDEAPSVEEGKGAPGLQFSFPGNRQTEAKRD